MTKFLNRESLDFKMVKICIRCCQVNRLKTALLETSRRQLVAIGKCHNWLSWGVLRYCDNLFYLWVLLNAVEGLKHLHIRNKGVHISVRIAVDGAQTAGNLYNFTAITYVVVEFC